MTDTPRQRRTAASILDDIRKQYAAEEQHLKVSKAAVEFHATRLNAIYDVFKSVADKDDEIYGKNGEAE